VKKCCYLYLSNALFFLFVLYAFSGTGHWQYRGMKAMAMDIIFTLVAYTILPLLSAFFFSYFLNFIAGLPSRQLQEPGVFLIVTCIVSFLNTLSTGVYFLDTSKFLILGIMVVKMAADAYILMHLLDKHSIGGAEQ
jgi:hypothetical protein